MWSFGITDRLSNLHTSLLLLAAAHPPPFPHSPPPPTPAIPTITRISRNNRKCPLARYTTDCLDKSTYNHATAPPALSRDIPTKEAATPARTPAAPLLFLGRVYYIWVRKTHDAVWRWPYFHAGCFHHLPPDGCGAKCVSHTTPTHRPVSTLPRPMRHHPHEPRRHSSLSPPHSTRYTELRSSWLWRFVLG